MLREEIKWWRWWMAFLMIASVVFAQEEPEDDSPGRSFTIAEGSKWAGPFLRRAVFWWGPTTTDEASMGFVFERPDEPVQFTIKLFGLSMARFSRAPAHHDSDRFIATFLDDGVRISPYAYREGEISPGGRVSALVRFDEPVELHLRVSETGTTYTIVSADTTASTFVPRDAESYRRIKLKNFAHARGGTFREAPVEVRFRAFLLD